MHIQSVPKINDLWFLLLCFFQKMEEYIDVAWRNTDKGAGGRGWNWGGLQIFYQSVQEGFITELKKKSNMHKNIVENLHPQKSKCKTLHCSGYKKMPITIGSKLLSKIWFYMCHLSRQTTPLAHRKTSYYRQDCKEIIRALDLDFCLLVYYRFSSSNTYWWI